MEQKQPVPSSPLPNQPSSSLLRDISNFKTPKPQKQRHQQTNPSFNFESPCPQFFTALKQTPRSSYSTTRRRPRHSLAAQRLKAVELEQSKSARKNQTSKEKSLKSLAKSLTVWLNFLFENPRSCGVEVSRFTGEDSSDGSSEVFSGGKRDSISHGGVGVDRQWRGPKRRKDTSWVHNGDAGKAFSNSTYSRLQASLADVCSLDDLQERMAVYFSLTSCKEIFDVMTQVTKSIDEGRLKMKAHCPIVTDVGMKENASRILMCYNPVWLRVGLYIIFGGESLLPNSNPEMGSDQDLSFLKMVTEKLFFSHAALAKAYVYNKLVDGVYRPGYYEKLGSVILKKFLLLALVLDRAKSQSSLPVSHGIDGLDGGSPLLFVSQSDIKSSCEMVSSFLSPDVMHGVGNLLAHLMILGYKVSYQQSPLVEYTFTVTDLFNDLRDGVRLCRALQLLQHDPTVFKKVIVPSDDRKKNLANCAIVLQHLKHNGVPLYDEDGVEIIGDDVVNGDKELIVSLLWNMFVHLQVPLLVNNKLVSDEITKIRGPETILPSTLSHLDMLLQWIQAICENYDLKVENFSSLVDGKAMWCLLDYYFRKENSHMDVSEKNREASIVSASDYVDAVHNFVLSQKLTTLLGNFPEVLQVSDILEYKGACSDRGVIILLVFLSSQLLVKRNMQQINLHKLLGQSQTAERKCIRRDRAVANHEGTLKNVGETCRDGSKENMRSFKAIMAWWQEMAQHNSNSNLKPVHMVLQSFSDKPSSDNQRESAARIIQSRFRRAVEHRRYTQIKKTVSFLQAVTRAWLMAKTNPVDVQIPSCGTETFSRYTVFMAERHAFVKLTRSVVSIQRAIRKWIRQNQKDESNDVQVKAALTIQAAWRNHVDESVRNRWSSAATVIQARFRRWVLRKSFLNRKQAATRLQCCIRGWLARRRFVSRKQAVATVQGQVRGWLARRSVANQRHAARKVQAHVRGWLSRKRFTDQQRAARLVQRFYRRLRCLREFERYRLELRSAVTIQSYIRGWMARREADRCRHVVVLIQSLCRGRLMRRAFSSQKKAATTIQNAFQSTKSFKTFKRYKHAATEIQRFARGCIARRRLRGAGAVHDLAATRDGFGGNERKMHVEAALKLQRWWRGVLLEAKTRTRSAIVVQSHVRRWLARRQSSAIVIQSHVRGWLARRTAAQRRQRIVLIQSYWKGYVERKHSRAELLDLRSRVRKSAANVDDSMRLINRLLAALSELKNMKSVSGILHTCATLDMATAHSRRCCEQLVAAGAINTLLGLIRSVSRSIPDQEVLRHTLSTLRNLTRHPHLTEALVDTRGSGETVLWEFLRNKEEAYFVAAELLRNVCSIKKGVEKMRNLHGLMKRLHNHVEELKRKADYGKRNPRTVTTKEQTDRRLREAVEILRLITNG